MRSTLRSGTCRGSGDAATAGPSLQVFMRRCARGCCGPARRATAGLALLLATALAASETTGQEPSRVTIDLTRPAARGSLSFDEPVLLVGAAPAEVDSIGAFRRELGRSHRQGCPSIASAAPGGTVSAATAGPSALRPVSHTRLTSLRPAADRRPGRDDPRDGASHGLPGFTLAGPVWKRDAAFKSDSFALLVEPLRPDRNYLFCVRTYSHLSGSTLDGFRAGVMAKVDSILRQMKPRETAPGVFEFEPLGDAVAQEVRAAFREAVPRQANRTVVASSGSIFSGEPTSGLDALKQVLNVTGPLNDRLEVLNRLTPLTEVAPVELGAFTRRSGRTLRALLQGIRPSDTVLALPPAMTARALETMRVLVTAPPDLLNTVSLGLAVPSDSGSALPEQVGLLDTIWSEEAAAARAARVRETRTRLDEVRALAAAVAVSPRLQRRLGISPGSLGTAVEGLNSLRQSMFQLHAAFSDLAAANRAHRTVLNSAVNRLTVAERRTVPVFGSTVEIVLETRARRYVSAELGVAYAFDLAEAVPYFGVTLFPFGVNKRVPQSLSDPVRSTVGLMVGVTASSVAEPDVREDLFGNSAVLAGASWRFLDFFRASGGAMILRELDPATLSSESHIRATPYGALAFDLDIQAVLGGLGRILGGGK